MNPRSSAVKPTNWIPAFLLFELFHTILQRASNGLGGPLNWIRRFSSERLGNATSEERAKPFSLMFTTLPSFHLLRLMNIGDVVYSRGRPRRSATRFVARSFLYSSASSPTRARILSKAR